MTGLRVISAGLAPSIQDLGRPQVQHLGVPPSGALDPEALRVANALVGNPEDAACLEIRLMGPMLEVTAESVRIALAGTEVPIEVTGARPASVPAHQSLRLARGRRFRIGGLADTGVAYLAVEGGFDLPEVFGSRSTYGRAGIGGLDGRPIRDGDLLPLRLTAVAARQERRCANTAWRTRAGPVRVMLGPQDDFFTPAALETLLTAEYTVTREADRMGIRLDGPRLEHAKGHDIVSDGIPTGAIQVPGNGQPILLLADHQTTGGYPKPAVVISADVPRLGRLRFGDALRFAAVSVAEAERARQEAEARIRLAVERLAPAEPWLDEEALYRENLVTGAVGP